MTHTWQFQNVQISHKIVKKTRSQWQKCIKMLTIRTKNVFRRQKKRTTCTLVHPIFEVTFGASLLGAEIPHGWKNCENFLKIWNRMEKTSKMKFGLKTIKKSIKMKISSKTEKLSRTGICSGSHPHQAHARNGRKPGTCFGKIWNDENEQISCKCFVKRCQNDRFDAFQEDFR